MYYITTFHKGVAGRTTKHMTIESAWERALQLPTVRTIGEDRQGLPIMESKAKQHGFTIVAHTEPLVSK